MNYKIEKILNQSTAIRPFTISPVKNICNSFKMKNLNEVKPFNSNISEWLSDYIDLSDFPYLYPMNGITEAMNYWMAQETRTIEKKKDDYAWIPFNETGDVIYISVPSSIDGNYCDIPTHKPVVLDIAFVGSAACRKIHPPKNVEMVFFSLSKCFGLRNYRIGYMWSKKPIDRLELLINSAKYYNYYAMQLGEIIIDNIPLSLTYKTIQSYQKEICDELNLTPSDTVWLATSDDPTYSKFFKNYTNRISIIELIEEQYDKSIENIQPDYLFFG